jgi:phosphohistidine phosphatase SixA
MNSTTRAQCFRWSRVVVACAAIAAVFGVRAESLDNQALVKALRHGGYVLVMRHASSPRTPPDPSAAQSGNVKGERELDETGRRTASTMGKEIHRLRIPIGDIWSSPTFRALQTIKLAGIGEVKTVPELGDGGQGMGADTEGTRSAWLRQQVARIPRAGTNSLLVTHMPNILGAFSQQAAHIADGEALVFRPDGKGSATLVARVKIEQWPHLKG